MQFVVYWGKEKMYLAYYVICTFINTYLFIIWEWIYLVEMLMCFQNDALLHKKYDERKSIN